jgi:transcriptional regulator with XRE-family HTH domain
MDMSQEDFAEIIGMSVDFLSLIERGRNSPSFPKLEKMARELNKPVAYFFDFEHLSPQRSKRR